MAKKETLQIFEDRKVRSVWDAEGEKWYISVVDVIAVLTGSANPRRDPQSSTDGVHRKICKFSQ
jgi:hypothetical protein